MDEDASDPVVKEVKVIRVKLLYFKLNNKERKFLTRFHFMAVQVPVFLSKTLAEKLFIFQYPLRSTREGYDNTTFLKTSIKPENQEVQLEVSLDTENVNYDHSKGEQIVINVDGSSKPGQDEEKPFDRYAKKY